MDNPNLFTVNRLLRTALCLTLLLTCTTTTASDDDSNADRRHGVIKLESRHSVSETIDRLETILRKKGMTIFKRVNHSAGAENAGLHLRPTELLIFGNPKVGTPLMQCSQTIALDLPQKMLAYQDSEGIVWLSYNDPNYIAKRHTAVDCQQQVDRVSKALAKFSTAASNYNSL